MRDRSTVLAGALLALSACTAVSSPGASPHSASAEPSTGLGSDSAAESAGEPQASATAGPALPIASPAPGELGPIVGAQVVVDGLAVRTGPGTSYPLTAGRWWDATTGTELLPVPEIRLWAGYYAYVSWGPLVVAGVPWYFIGPQWQPGEVQEHVLRWDGGWVAGGSGGDPYLVPADVPPDPSTEPYGKGPDPYAVLYAIGSARSATFHAYGGGFIVEWYAADPDGAACDLTIAVRPNGDEIESARVEGWGHGRLVWPPDMGGAEGDYWIDVESDCSWSLIVSPIVG